MGSYNTSERTLAVLDSDAVLEAGDLPVPVLVHEIIWLWLIAF